ncbi:hypothetical protein F1714_12165, partial [Streptococcus pneumoniae]
RSAGPAQIGARQSIIPGAACCAWSVAGGSSSTTCAPATQRPTASSSIGWACANRGSAEHHSRRGLLRLVSRRRKLLD